MKLKGAPPQRFFSQSWALQLEPGELEAVEHQDRGAEAEKVVRSLQEENKKIKMQVLSLNNKLKEVSSREPRKQYKSMDELGARQKQQLKQARSSTCKASLGWLDEGLHPHQYTGVEQIHKASRADQAGECGGATGKE